MKPTCVVSTAGSDAHGSTVAMVSCEGDTTVIVDMLARAAPVRALAFTVSSASLTAAASTGVPSEKFTPARRSTVHVLKSALGVNDLARYGAHLPSAS